MNLPSPTLRDGTVKISVRAAGVSFAMLLVMEGKHQNRPEPPFTPGTEVAGVVLEIGKGVTGLVPGDRVIASVRSGGCAEEIVVEGMNVHKIPKELSFASAIWFPTIYPTAYVSFERARLKRDEIVLVHGGAGASGLAAIQIAKVQGARVIATVSSKAKEEVVLANGADHAINHTSGELRDMICDITGGKGIDIVFDPVGGSLFDTSMRCIRQQGRLVTIGYASGTIPSIALNRLLLRNLELIGVYWGYYLGWTRESTPQSVRLDARRIYAEVLDQQRSGLLRPIVDKTFRIDDAIEAFRMVERREVIGKLALTMGE